MTCWFRGKRIYVEDPDTHVVKSMPVAQVDGFVLDRFMSTKEFQDYILTICKYVLANGK